MDCRVHGVAKSQTRLRDFYFQQTGKMQDPSLGWKDALEKDMATHSSILAWRIPWIDEPGRLQSMGLQSQTQLKQLSMQHARIDK